MALVIAEGFEEETTIADAASMPDIIENLKKQLKFGKQTNLRLSVKMRWTEKQTTHNWFTV